MRPGMNSSAVSNSRHHVLTVKVEMLVVGEYLEITRVLDRKEAYR